MTGPKMWPAKLPAEVRAHPLRQAEVKVYDLLKEQLGSSWTVFYSRPWLGLTPTGEEKDGECDFFVVHPERGYLAIEVKGGGIKYIPETETWLSIDRREIRRTIKNPVAQARSSKHELLKKLQAHRDWPASLFIRIRHGIVLPDAVAPAESLGPDQPPEIFCCRPDMARLGDWVRRRLSGGSGQPITAARLAIFEQILARPFALKAPLAHYLDEDDGAIALLMPQQFHILDSIQDVKRAAVGGGAGTGKTVIAVEDAMRLAQRNLSTVLTCRSDRLACDLRDRLAASNVRVLTFSELCRSLADAAGVDASDDVSEEVAVDRALKAVEFTPSLRPDALIIDEAQDFPSHWWVALEAMVSDHPEATLHAFYDTNQKVYGAIRGQLTSFDLVPIGLTRNYRNTRLIHEACGPFYEGLPVTAEGPEGTPVEWVTSGDSTLELCVARTVQRLTGGDAVAPTDIVVLAASDTSRGKLAHALNRHILDGLLVETIQAFKGLERRVAIVAAEPDIVEQPELIYVALSRARAHMLVAGDAATLEWIRTEASSGAVSG